MEKKVIKMKTFSFLNFSCLLTLFQLAKNGDTVEVRKIGKLTKNEAQLYITN